MTDSEAENRYRRAAERLEAIRGAWEAEGSPKMCEGRGGPVVHPLLKEIRALEIVVDRLAARAKPGRVGRPPAAVPGIPEPLRWRGAYSSSSGTGPGEPIGA